MPNAATYRWKTLLNLSRLITKEKEGLLVIVECATDNTTRNVDNAMGFFYKTGDGLILF